MMNGATSQSGTYVLTLTAAGSGIVDAGQEPLATGASDSFSLDLVAPTVLILDPTPAMRTTPVSSRSRR